MKKILCFFGFHTWFYKSNKERTCKICSKTEVYFEGSAITGMADDSYWDKVKE